MAPDLIEAIISRTAPENISAEASIERVVVDVTIGDRTEVVCVTIRKGEVRCVSSDGKPEGPFAQAALRFLAGQGGHFRDSGVPDLGEDSRPASTAKDADAVPNALNDLITAVCRVGIDEASTSPSFSEAIDRVLEVAPNPTPLALLRWLGRLQHAIEHRRVSRVARLIEGAARLSAHGSRDAQAKPGEISSWLDAMFVDESGASMMVDRTLIELGREWLYAARGNYFERRYLIDMKTGDFYREDRRRNEPTSLGPCPREIDVGLARVYPGAEPRPLHLLQYAVKPDISSVQLERIEQFASVNFSDVCTRYRRALVDNPGLAEPFVVLRPQEVLWTHPIALLDKYDAQLSLDDKEEAGAYRYAKRLFAEGTPIWIAGRLVDDDGQLSLIPIGAAITRGSFLVYRRLV